MAPKFFNRDDKTSYVNLLGGDILIVIDILYSLNFYCLKFVKIEYHFAPSWNCNLSLLLGEVVCS